jgi:hypothetical protein
MGDEYDKELCLFVHKIVDEKLVTLEGNMNGINKQLKHIFWVGIGILISIIGVLLPLALAK